MQKTHHLKTWPEFFEQVRLGQKLFEIRREDRAFESGDLVVLEEWSPVSKKYSGRSLEFQIGFLTNLSWVGLQDGFCAFTLLPTRAAEHGMKRTSRGGEETPNLPEEKADTDKEGGALQEWICACGLSQSQHVGIACEHRPAPTPPPSAYPAPRWADTPRK